MLCTSGNQAFSSKCHCIQIGAGNQRLSPNNLKLLWEEKPDVTNVSVCDCSYRTTKEIIDLWKTLGDLMEKYHVINFSYQAEIGERHEEFEEFVLKKLNKKVSISLIDNGKFFMNDIVKYWIKNYNVVCFKGYNEDVMKALPEAKNLTSLSLTRLKSFEKIGPLFKKGCKVHYVNIEFDKGVEYDQTYHFIF